MQDAGKPAATPAATETQRSQEALTQALKPPSTPEEKPGPEHFIKKRIEQRESLKKENEDLKKRLEEHEKKLQELATSKPSPATEGPSIFDDPDGWARNREEQFMARLRQESEEKEAVVAHGAAAESAVKWLLSQSHVSEDPQFAGAVAEAVAHARNLYTRRGDH